MNVNDVLQATRSEGPGLRAILWLQGCTRRCEGCMNPDTHAQEPRTLVEVNDLIDWTLSRKDLEGVTISGGEPLLQAGPLAEYLEGVSEAGLSVILYTGYTLGEILKSGSREQKRCLRFTDLLIDGPFEKNKILPFGLRGSSNQQFHFLSDRYTLESIESYEKKSLRRREVVVRCDGTGIVIGGVR